MGGNAVPGTSRIPASRLFGVIDSVLGSVPERLGLRRGEVVLLGSAGKREATSTYGDLDVAVPILTLEERHHLTASEAVEFVLERASSASRAALHGGGGAGLAAPRIVSFPWPIPGTADICQVDLMLGESVEWMSFMYNEPFYFESTCRGVHRNFLLFALAHFVGRVVLARDDGGEPVTWERYIFDMSRGLMRGVQTRLGKRGLLKNHVTLSRWLVTRCPTEAVRILLDSDDATARDAATFERLCALVESHLDPETRSMVYGFAARELDRAGLGSAPLLAHAT
jgi:hypothetical protein